MHIAFVATICGLHRAVPLLDNRICAVGAAAYAVGEKLIGWWGGAHAKKTSCLAHGRTVFPFEKVVKHTIFGLERAFFLFEQQSPRPV